MTVFLEANPFASRLHVLAPLVSGAVAAGHRSVVVVPQRPDGTDWSTFMEEVPESVEIIVVEHVRVAPGVMVNRKELLALLSVARRVFRRVHRKFLVFTAIDDYLSKMLWVALFVRAWFQNVRVIAFRYRVDDLVLGTRFDVRIFAKQALFWFVRLLARPEWVIFDERVPLEEGMHIVPDPWSGPFESGRRERSREALGWRRDDDIILLVGRQDARKGIDVAVEALDILQRHKPSMKVVLIGQVAVEYASYQHKLARNLGDRFVHVEHYVTDSDLATYFSASSVVLLPYHSNFTATSGVLVRAAASGTPVVGSSHGLIGWRIRHYSLGETFEYPLYQTLADQILRVLDAPFEESRALAFADLSTPESLASRFEQILASESGGNARSAG
ncbi:glycosyltransferase family 4 protein [Sinomonas flava]|uniref:glycosyltransferase family 4 protein n=1 Tax=Sinomonas flava TaxID=496857 RepID=UPI0039A41E2A